MQMSGGDWQDWGGAAVEAEAAEERVLEEDTLAWEVPAASRN